MLWRTILAYFLPSAHPGLRPVKDGRGEEFHPKINEWGRRVDEGDWGNVWEGYQADKIREHNRALVRPYMGLYIRRWAVTGGLLWLLSQGLGALGLRAGAWTAFALAVLSLVMVVMLVLLRQEIRN
ncbi:MAG TPA: hypothetical protein VKA55_01020 [Gammaproteobacteria bacterium]|nr:hypothetical protein [Gammaproteobacteria bacterium]